MRESRAPISAYLELDLTTKCLTDTRSGEEIGLTFAEAAVLAFLINEPNVIHSKQTLLAQGWPDCVVASSSITQCISTLRKKLEPFEELQLRTEVRRGYMLQFTEPAPIKVNGTEVDVPLSKVKKPQPKWMLVAGTLLVMALLAWYFSDLHRALQHSSAWHQGNAFSLQVAGVSGDTELFVHGDHRRIGSDMWQRHLVPNQRAPEFLTSFKGFAATDGNNYSMALCPQYQTGYCPGENLINISTVTKAPAELSIEHFLQYRDLMEGRINYNNLPQIAGRSHDSDVTEHYYHSNIYFPTANKVLVRADFSMSLVYEDDTSGKFSSATCLSDQGCDTTPVKYNIRGSFKSYMHEIGDKQVEVFKVTLDSKELTKPDVVSESASDFYLMLRKNSIFDNEIYFYRVYQDEKTAVWLVPMYGNLAVWMTRQQLEL